jgi:hypothetical protein
MSCLHKQKFEFSLSTALHGRTSCFFPLTKIVWLKAVHPFEVCQHTKCHGPTLTGACFTSTSEVCTSVVLEWLKLLDLMHGAEVIFSCISSRLNFLKIYHLGQKIWGGGKQTDRIMIS